MKGKSERQLLIVWMYSFTLIGRDYTRWVVSLMKRNGPTIVTLTDTIDTIWCLIWRCIMIWSDMIWYDVMWYMIWCDWVELMYTSTTNIYNFYSDLLVMQWSLIIMSYLFMIQSNQHCLIRAPIPHFFLIHPWLESLHHAQKLAWYSDWGLFHI